MKCLLARTRTMGKLELTGKSTILATKSQAIREWNKGEELLTK